VTGGLDGGAPLLPIRINVEIDGRCNLACSICPYKPSVRRNVYMPLETVARLLEQIKEFGSVVPIDTSTTYLHVAGEPLLHPQLPEVIRAFNKAGIVPALSTNGVLLTPEVVDSLTDVQLWWLLICVDTLDKELYSRIRVGGSFETVIANIDYALAAGLSVPISVQLLVNCKGQTSTADDYRQRWGDIVQVFEKPIYLFAQQVTSDLLLARQADSAAGFVVGDRCTRADINVLADGQVVFCCNDLTALQPVGNIYQHSLVEMWNSSRWKEIRARMGRGDYSGLPLCQQCLSKTT
jgi:sulfatase maturation enzyme AslB (radical SAM superfamily)